MRNHHSARDIKGGTILAFVALSISLMNGTFTRLKKYNRPSQVIPARRWTQRNSIRRFVWASLGNVIWDRVRPEVKRIAARSCNAMRFLQNGCFMIPRL
jgi:hypothetical protein